MGWSINEMENTVTLTKEQADTLNPKVADLCPDHFYEGDTPFIEERVRDIATGKVSSTGRYICYFDSDHGEHMDWLTNDETVLQLIADAGAEGRVCFGSEEGDDAGEYWGVEFASGKYRHLKAEIRWIPVDPEPVTVNIL